MRKQSIAFVLAAACVLSVEGAPTVAPAALTKDDTLRLPQHQTACIVDVIQNNTDPDTHLVSPIVEVLLMKCFAFPRPPRCPANNPNCMNRENRESAAAPEAVPAEKTEETARSEAETTSETQSRADLTTSTELPSTATGEATPGPAGRADIVPCKADPTARGDSECSGAAPESSQPEDSSPVSRTTPSTMARSSEIPVTTAASTSPDVAREGASSVNGRSDDPKVTESTTTAAGRSDAISSSPAPTPVPEAAGSANARADAPEVTSTTETQGRSDEAPSSTTASSSPEEMKDVACADHARADAPEVSSTTEGQGRSDRVSSSATPSSSSEEMKEGEGSEQARAIEPETSTTTEKAGRSDETPSTTASSSPSEEKKGAASSPNARADEPKMPVTTEVQGRSDEVSSTTAPSVSSESAPVTIPKVPQTQAQHKERRQTVGVGTPKDPSTTPASEAASSTPAEADDHPVPVPANPLPGQELLKEATKAISARVEESDPMTSTVLPDEPVPAEAESARADTLAPQQAKERTTLPPQMVQEFSGVEIFT